MHTSCPTCRASVSFALDDLPSEVACGICGQSVAPDITSGVSVASYRLKRSIGSGGMARVFLAEEGNLKRDVALKVLHQQYRNDDGRVQQFLTEARTAAQLNHPGIVQIYSMGQSDGLTYFGMELVRGASVKELIEKGPRSLDWSLNVATKVAKALQYAWEHQSLVHRDIKPDNIMVRNDGNVKLTDFGLASAVNEIRDGDFIEGSPHYLAPEPILGAPIDFRSDIYSLGATLYHMVTGSFAFVGDSPTETAYMQAFNKLEAPHERNADVPLPASNLICRMMAKKPRQRFDSYEDLLDALNELRSSIAKTTTPVIKIRHTNTSTATPVRKIRKIKTKSTRVARKIRKNPVKTATPVRIIRTSKNKTTVKPKKRINATSRRASSLAAALALALAMFASAFDFKKPEPSQHPVNEAKRSSL